MNQKQRYVAMLQHFIGEWESWHMWLRLTFKNNVDTAGYTEALVSHLFRSMEMLITAITSDDIDATDLSTDMFMLWLNQGSFIIIITKNICGTAFFLRQIFYCTLFQTTVSPAY